MNFDPNKYARNTNLQLIIGGILILFIVGEGLIFFLLGPSAAVMGLLCIGAGFIPIVVIYLVFLLIDWIVKNARKE
ncbi:MAG: hypothetical protein LWX83_17360 [Anaerolineae bacterium]|nr:hypothetical protein [Anaerolineae bacterium]